MAVEPFPYSDPNLFIETPEPSNFLNPLLGTARPSMVGTIETSTSNWGVENYLNSTLELGNGIQLTPTGQSIDLQDLDWADTAWAKFTLQQDGNNTGIDVFLDINKGGVICVRDYDNRRRMIHFNTGNRNTQATSHRTVGAEFAIAQGVTYKTGPKPSSLISDLANFRITMGSPAKGFNLMRRWNKTNLLVASGLHSTTPTNMTLIQGYLQNIAATIGHLPLVYRDSYTELLGLVAEKEQQFFMSK